MVRHLLRAWAKTGKAPGWLYQILEDRANSFSSEPIIKQLRNGLTVECSLSDHVQRQIYFFGAYEPIELSLFLGTLKEGSTVVDAGANIGFYSLMASQEIGPAGRIFSFEPVPETFARLTENVERNALNNITPVNQALWNKSDTLRFSLAKENEQNIGGYSFSESETAVKHTECQAIPLDEFATQAGIERIDAMKMDIEGAERFALEGAAGMISRDHPVILLEVCRQTCGNAGYSPDDLWDFLKGHGYRAYVIGSNFENSGWIEDFSEIIQRNVLLFPEGDSFPFSSWDDKIFRKRYL